jgi:hypothetical protein
MSYLQNTPTQTHTVFLDSRFCEQRTPSFNYILETALRASLGVNMLLTVENCTFPVTYPNINANNNLLTFTYDTGGGVYVPFTLTFAVGYYSVFDFVNELNSKLSIVFGGVAAPPMVASVNRNTCRITIACANPASVIEPTTCGDLIGIGRGTDNELLIPLAANLNPAYTIAFPRGFNFGGTPYAFLKMSSVNLNNINSNGEINDCLCRIPINAPQGGLCNYRPSDPIRFVLQRAEINSISLRLEDRDNNPIIPDELQVLLRVDFIVPVDASALDEGTIDFFYRENGVPTQEEIDDEEDIIGT